MSDPTLSQDEISALLSGVSTVGGADPMNAYAGKTGAKIKENLDAVAAGKSIEFLSGTYARVAQDAFLTKVEENAVAIQANFSGEISGDHIFVMDDEIARKIVELNNGDENAEMDDMALSILSEFGTQQTAAEINELCAKNIVHDVEMAAPTAQRFVKNALPLPNALDFGVFTYGLDIEGNHYNIYEVVSNEVAAGIARAVGVPQNAQPNAARTMPNVQNVQFSGLKNVNAGAEPGNIGLIMDVMMEMTVELGRTKKQIKEILSIGEGTVIELDKLAGEPVDVLVNHKQIAKGEVVVIDENFGVRITEILPKGERAAMI